MRGALVAMAVLVLFGAAATSCLDDSCQSRYERCVEDCNDDYPPDTRILCVGWCDQEFDECIWSDQRPSAPRSAGQPSTTGK